MLHRDTGWGGGCDPMGSLWRVAPSIPRGDTLRFFHVEGPCTPLCHCVNAALLLLLLL